MLCSFEVFSEFKQHCTWKEVEQNNQRQNIERSDQNRFINLVEVVRILVDLDSKREERGEQAEVLVGKLS